MALDNEMGMTSLAGVARPGVLALFVVTLVVLASYAGIFSHDFIKYDDGRMIVERSGAYDGLNFENIRGIFLGDYPREEPLIVRDLSYLVNAEIFGVHNAFGYLLGNVLLHIGVSLLVYLLALRLFGDARHGLALLAAVLFAVHPVHVESIAWISSRKDPLYAFFFLAALLGYDSFLTGRKKAFLAGALALFTLSLFSKAAAVAFVPVALVWRLVMGPRQALSKAETLFFVACVSATVFFVFWYTGVLTDYGLLTDKSFSRPDWGLWLLAVCEYLTFYLGKLVFPLRLSTFYDFPGPAQVFTNLPYLALAVAVVIGITVLSLFAGFRKDRRLLFLSAFFLCALFPYFDIARVSIYVADRYLYLASVAFCLALAWAVTALWAKVGRKSRQTLVLFGAALLLLLGARTWTAAATWENTATFWKNAYAVAPGRPDTHSGLMSQYLGFYESYPQDPQAPAALEEAGELGRRALARFCPEKKCSGQVFYVTTLMGKYYWYKGDNRKAEHFFKKTLRLNANYHVGRYIYGIFLSRQGRYPESRAQFEAILAGAHPVLYKKLRSNIESIILPAIRRQMQPATLGNLDDH